MLSKHRVFWEALADAYEEWATEPLMDHRFGCAIERFTCDILGFNSDGQRWGWLLSAEDPADSLGAIWAPWFGHTCVPAGITLVTVPGRPIEPHPLRPENRARFCWYMADTIRHFLETGEFEPWGDN